HIANNLANKLIRSRDGGSGVVESNIDQAPPEWFVNPVEGDLHLASFIDIGGIILTNEVPDDIDQTPRYVGTGFEIGADELLATDTKGFIVDEIKIFPNPGPGRFNIIGFSHDMSVSNIEVYNAIGRRIDV